MRGLLLSSLLFAAATGAGAAEWSATPVVGWAVDHASNRRLVADGDEGQGGSISLDLLLRRETATTQFSLRPRAQFFRYTDDTVADANNRALLLSSLWRREHSSWLVSGSISDEDTLTSEIEETGIVDRNTRRRSMTATTTWSQQQSERLSVDVQLSFADVKYRGEDAALLPGYQYPSASVTGQFAMTPRTTLSVAAFGSELDSGYDFGDSRSTGLRVGGSHALTTNMTLLVTVGVNQRSFEGGDDRGYVGQFDLTREGILGRWRLYAERNVAASGRGVLVERDEAGLSVIRAFTPRTTATFGARTVRNDELGKDFSTERRRYEVADAGLDWRASPAWLLGLRASYSRAQRLEAEDLVDGWRTALQFTWTPQRLALSR